jgi:acetylglutamate kinase
MHSTVIREVVPPGSEPSEMAREDSCYSDYSMGRLHGHTVVIKYGGAAMEEPHLRDLFARDIASLRAAGTRPVIVHGGGPQISRLMKRSGKTPRFVAGMRVTDDETMVLVESALRQINEEIVRLIEHQRVPVAGFGGWEKSLIGASRRLHVLPTGESLDLGRVGDVASVNARPIRELQERAIVPVLAPVGIGGDALTYNINADLVAGEVAAVLGASLVVFLTDVPGIVAPDGCRYRRLSRWGADSLVHDGAIDGDMLPKVEAAVRALKGGAGQAHIIDGRIPHAVIRSLRTRHGLGTEIVL